jgi:glycosyltransferase involved in cell wall biosynthesis
MIVCELNIQKTRYINNNNMKCSIIIPCYKEAKNLKKLLPKIQASMTQASLLYELIIVDDNSQDGTETLIKEMAKTIPVTLLIRKNERGLSSAVIHGMNSAKGDILVCMDGDMSHNPKYLPKLIAPLIDQPSCEFVLASRFISGGEITKDWSSYRHLNSKIATTLCRPLINKAITDPVSGFFALKKDTYKNAAPLTLLGFKIGLELLIKCHCQKIIEIPIHFEDRLEGQSKLNSKEQINYIIHLNHLYDYVYPVLSSIIKFSITFLLGLLACFFLLSFDLGLSQKAGLYIYYAPFIAVQLSFFAIYYSYSKEAIKNKQPLLSYTFRLLVELTTLGIGVSLFPNTFMSPTISWSLIILGVTGRLIGKTLVKKRY